MDIGILILLNLSTIPFLSEFDYIACVRKARPRIGQVLALANFRQQRWAIGFAVLWALFAALALSSSKPHPANMSVLGLVLLCQVACWGYAAFRAKHAS